MKSERGDPLVITLSGLPPSVWVAYGQRMRSPGKFMKAPAREWRDGAVDEARCQYKRKPIEGRLEVYVEFLIKSRGRWDIDNRCKILLDALTMAGVWVDDSQIDFLAIKIMVNGKQKEIKTIVRIKEVS